ncbi:hypothetical protein N7462_002819 [Penicillium macrosclerotiorum]|uniref:uncharacterized protein n=1 Tax=Penicillium macrosclerotiorum TaxID=303699 RepID=UPI0025468892|nr:uncharacterized protein N7462_002819 [Penicillium macrosclerotiorum]KAJ5693396.1 hypothetical protein N7462_002819 [Penicillium macrosclerotiorum]
MSNPPDRPWDEEEKYTLLTEILKKAGVSSSYLVRLINDFRIVPNWEHIPLPQGRSLSACRMAFRDMQLQYSVPPPATPVAVAPTTPAVPPAPAGPIGLTLTGPPAPLPMARPDVPGTSTHMDSGLRKRPLFPAEKPLIPRAIQPRPPASTASYSSESSAQLSPRLDSTMGSEPPRKRGRPSKAETERRKAAAEARGETYPPPRRSGSGRLKIPPSPTSPAGPSMGPYPPSAIHPGPPQGPTPGPLPYDIPGSRPLAPAPGIPHHEERREMPTRGMGPNMRELPRPAEMSHPLPSPHALQLGPPSPFSRLNSNPGERGSYGSIPPDRYSPTGSSRRDSVASRGELPPGPYPDSRTSTTPAEKPTR